MGIPTSRAIGQTDPSPRGVSREVVDAIRDASKRSGVDFKFMLAKAQTESSFDPGAKARTSSASGLYQFIESTWLNTVRQHGAKHGLGQYAAQIEDDFGGGPKVRDAATRKTILDLRFDPRAASSMAAEFARSNHNQLENALGSGVNATDLYLAHFLGAGGATRFLASHRQDPQRIAAAQCPEAAAANRGVFYDAGGRSRTLDQVYRFFESKMTRDVADVAAIASTDAPAVKPVPRSAAAASATPALPPQLQALASQFGLKGAALKPETIMAMALLAEPLVDSVRGGASLFDNGSAKRGGRIFNPDIGV
jgi:hypothetical protein